MNHKLVIVLWLGAAISPVAALAQAPAPAPASPATNVPTGTPEGVSRMQPQNSRGFPAPQTIEGQPIETRPPELSGDHPVFPGETRAPYHATTPYTVTTITDQLKAPWSLAFLPGGKLLVTEKGGTMRFVDAQGSVSQSLTGVPEVAAVGQVGLLDLALDPKFATNKRVFFSYSEAVSVPGSEIVNSNIVVARAHLDVAGGALTDVTVIFRAKPSLPRQVSANQGGRIAIERDGNLFVTIGDRSGSPPWDMAQRLDTDLGKIIHITPDGAPAKDNPFIGQTGVLPEIWSIGHRSEEGLAIDPTGQLWENENGPRGGDKLIRVVAGKNYGWPVYVHGLDYPGEMIAKGAVDAAGTEQPVYYWDPVIAPSGLAFYQGKLFPQWKGSVFVGGLRAQFLDRLSLSADNKVVNEEPLLVDQHSRIRDVRIGPDGAVYVLADNGKLFKLTPK